jgi:hypothetical protein
LKEFYFAYKLEQGHEEGVFVALEGSMQGPTIPIEDDSPVVAVRYCAPMMKCRRIYRPSELMSEWDKLAEEAVKVTYAELHKSHTRHRKNQSKTQQHQHQQQMMMMMTMTMTMAMTMTMGHPSMKKH